MIEKKLSATGEQVWVASRCEYPSKYKGAKPMEEQIKILRREFPVLASSSFDEEAMKEASPPGMEGKFGIPEWKLIALTYKKACKEVFKKLKEVRNGNFFNYRLGQLGLRYLRQSEISVKMFRKIAHEQKNSDILIISAQFGFKYRGYSSNEAKRIMSLKYEFGLGVFAIGIMLLTHPERLQHCNDLWIDCSGDEFNDGDGQFDHTPYFIFHISGVEFGVRKSNLPHACWGSAGGAIWQPLIKPKK